MHVENLFWILDLLGLGAIIYLQIKSLKVEIQTLEAYKLYFKERKDWYARRATRQLSPSLTPATGSVPALRPGSESDSQGNLEGS